MNRTMMRQLFTKSVLTVILLTFPLRYVSAQSTPEEKLNMVMYAIMNMYVDSVSKAQFVDRQIERIMQDLDPFTMYLPAQQALDKERAVLAQHPPKIPAMSQNNSSNPSGVKGTVTTSQKSRLSSLRYYMLDKTTGYIQLMIFSQTAGDDFRTAVADLRSEGMKHLIIDIRNNHGGLTDVAVDIADELLDGEKTIFTAEGAHMGKQVFKTTRTGCFEKGNVVLLTNGETMSAAELFAGAMQDWDRGIVVGENTFGKGLIQETLPFEDGSALQLSVARYFTPAGRNIQKPYNDSVPSAGASKTCLSLFHHRPLPCNNGIVPDVVVTAFPTPYETSWYTMFLITRAASEVANDYLVRHKATLKFKSEASFVNTFDYYQLQPFVDRKLQDMHITVSKEDYRKSIDRVLLEAKAYLGRSLFQSDNCYYRIIASNTNPAAEHHANLVLRKAWEMIKSPANY